MHFYVCWRIKYYLFNYVFTPLWIKALPWSRKYKATLVVQWSRPLLPVQRFPSGEGLNPGRVRNWSDAYSPPKWWPRCDIHTSHTLQGLLYDTLYYTVRLTVLYPLLTAACFSLLSSTILLSISLTSMLTNLCSATWMLGGELCGVKPCPDPGSISHHW